MEAGHQNISLTGALFGEAALWKCKYASYSAAQVDVFILFCFSPLDCIGNAVCVCVCACPSL